MEPTEQMITATLARAKELIAANHFDIRQAVAEAAGFEEAPGWKVFRDTMRRLDADPSLIRGVR